MALVDLVIKNARIVLEDKIFRGGLAIEQGKIVKIAKTSSLPKAEKSLDVKEKFLLPGGIDAHVHFRDFKEKRKEDWTSGSKAALAGGITTVLDMPNNLPPITSIKQLEEKRKLAKKKSLVNFGFHFAATNKNVDEIKKVKKIASIKFYLGLSTGELLISDTKTFEYFKILRERNIIATIHGEDNHLIQDYTQKMREVDKKGKNPLTYADSRPNICAAEAMNKLIYFSKFSQNRIHFCHVSTSEEIDLLRKHPFSWISSEVTPHHLFLSRKQFKKLKGFGKMNPPLRSDKDRRELWRGIKDKVIKIISSDHAPHLKKEKERANIWEVPAGVPGVETLLPLLLDHFNKGFLSLPEIVKLTSENPAKIFGIKNKGKIREGYEADLILVDLKKRKRVKSQDLFTKCKWSPFEGRLLKGWPVKTFVGGELLFNQGRIVKEKIKGEEVTFDLKNLG